MDRATRSRLVDHQRVAGLQLAQGLTQPGPVAAGAGGLGDDLPAMRRGERVELGLVSWARVETRAQPMRTLLS